MATEKNIKEHANNIIKLNKFKEHGFFDWMYSDSNTDETKYDLEFYFDFNVSRQQHDNYTNTENMNDKIKFLSFISSFIGKSKNIEYNYSAVYNGKKRCGQRMFLLKIKNNG